MRLYSIIIAVYNVEKFLEECLESVLRQDYGNWECILVDDGSTDENSAKICDAFVKKDSRFKVFHLENKGSLMARRYGLSQAIGDYLLFIDSDDYIHKELLKNVDLIISETQSDLVIYRFKWVNKVRTVDSELIFPEGTIIGEGGLPKKVLWEKFPTCNSLNNLWLKVVKRQCIDFEADYSKYAFLQFGTDLMQSLPILDRAQKIYFTEKIFYFYRYNDTGISSKKAKRNDMDSIDRYFYTKNTIMKEKLRYMEKYGTNSDKMIRSQYASYFKGCIETMISWLANEPDKKKRAQIIRRVVKDKSLIECKDYIGLGVLTGYDRKLFLLFSNNHFKKFSRVLNLLVIRRKMIRFKGNIIEQVAIKRNKKQKQR